MDFLVLTPPVSTPSEPSAGAFLLAAGLAARDLDVGLLDLSLAFFDRALAAGDLPAIGVDRALSYLLGAHGYAPERHRSAAGTIHKQLGGFSRPYPGWRLTLMDVVTPVRVHDLDALQVCLNDASPFAELWRDELLPVLERERPRQVVISIVYLSQLAASIDLVGFLERHGVNAIVGGPLIESLNRTGGGLEALSKIFRRIEMGDGRSLIGRGSDERMLDRMGWPRLMYKGPYLSARPILPLSLSVGCYWDRCLFCPDRDATYTGISPRAIDALLAQMPDTLRAQRPVVHLLDSAIPPALLRRFLPIARDHGVDFFGFARPTEHLRRRHLLRDAAESGCLMLQLGVEGGSGPLLDRFEKGIDPAESVAVLREAADVGIRTYVYLLFGLPGETEADRHATLKLIERNLDAVDFLNLSLFNLPSHCDLITRATEFDIELGSFPDDALRFYRPFTCHGREPRADARRFLTTDFERHPRIREILLRTPRWFRPAHLALMHCPHRRAPWPVEAQPDEA